MSTTPPSTFPFLLYGGDANDWYEGPHEFEVRFERPLTDEDFVTLAEIWVEHRNRASTDSWLFSGCFARFGVRTNSLAASLSVARGLLEEVSTAIVGIADVVCFAARDFDGSWTAWSVAKQARPAPGPNYEHLDRSMVLWARDVDVTLAEPAQSPEFDRNVARVANRAQIVALGAAADKAGLVATEVEAVAWRPAPRLAPQFRADGERPDKVAHADSSVPLAYRAVPPGIYKKLAYFYNDAVGEVSFDFEPRVIASHDNRAWVYAYGIHEVDFATGAVTKLFDSVTGDDSLWSGHKVITADGVFIYMTTASRLLSFRVTDDGLEPITTMKLRTARISLALGGRALIACGAKGVTCYATNAGEVKRAVTLAGVQAMHGPNDGGRVVITIGRVPFALEGLSALVDKKMPKPKKR